jgi:HPt (histidine-containing phosphotransfer) domain-containing protein
LGTIDESLFAELFALTEHDASLLAELVALFLTQLDSQSKAIRAAVSSHFAVQVEFHAHSLKSSSATFGAHELTRLCRNLELTAKEGVVPSANELAPFFLEVDAVEVWFRRWLSVQAAA